MQTVHFTCTAALKENSAIDQLKSVSSIVKIIHY